MALDPLTIDVKGHRLYAVPSVHFRVPFAEEVNELCRKIRPTAIAVELGPECAGSLWRWLKDLGIGTLPQSKRLPIMLALLKSNRRIRADMSEQAARLQELTGVDIDELSPTVLKHVLGYSSVSVLYLSPSDSIIEAARCAVELDVPLYGVDLEESPERKDIPMRLEDPTNSSGMIDRYVTRNEAYAESQRDPPVDQRREIAMAARLKSVLEEHERAVFVCGLAHWQCLKSLLADQELRPAPITVARDTELKECQRVVVHPVLAARYIDQFPAVTELYERHRASAVEDSGTSTRDAVDAKKLFADMLKETYRIHFGHERSGQQDRNLEDWESFTDFERLLDNLCTIRQRTVPDLMTALSCAQGTMTPEFCRTLAENLMKYNWVGPEKFPDHLVLCPAPSQGDKFQRAELVDAGGRRSRFFYVEGLPGHHGQSVEVPIPWEWSETPREKVSGATTEDSNWFPLDFLRTALSLQAIRLSRSQSARKRSVPFEGSLLAGIDLKVSMRAYVQGDEKLYVRELPRRKFSKPSSDLDGYPVVWIFRSDDAHNGQWTLGADRLLSFRKHFRDPKCLSTAKQKLRDVVVHNVAYSFGAPDDELTRHGCQVKRIVDAGSLSFHPTVFTVRQAARWGENTGFSRTPLYSMGGSSIESLTQYYREEHGLDPKAYDWKTALLLMAIPLAEKAVTVVAPDGYILSSVVYQEAARRDVALHHLPLSYFPRDKVKEASTTVMIPNLGRDPQTDYPIYPEHIERTLGQTPTTYKNLVPDQIHNYGQ